MFLKRRAKEGGRQNFPGRTGGDELELKWKFHSPLQATTPAAMAPTEVSRSHCTAALQSDSERETEREPGADGWTSSHGKPHTLSKYWQSSTISILLATACNVLATPAYMIRK